VDATRTYIDFLRFLVGILEQLTPRDPSKTRDDLRVPHVSFHD
jgi:hypothetical protein